MWRSYLTTTIWPLVFVELALLATYLITSSVQDAETRRTLEAMSHREVGDIAEREAETVAEKLRSVEGLTRVLRMEAGRALLTPREPSEAEARAYRMLPDGRFVTERDYGGSALFYSGRVPVGAAERERAVRSGHLDPTLRAVVKANPAVVQAYLNTRDSMCRIHPYFPVLDLFPPGMDIPAFNFYYEADAAHNPARELVWTDAYLDPAGQGWIVSSIAPVYVDDRLEGVVGIDITLGKMLEDILQAEIPWQGYAMLVGEDGTAIALPERAEKDWGIAELGTHDYQSAIVADTLKPADFNLFRRSDLAALARAVRSGPAGTADVRMDSARVIGWATIPNTGWTLLVNVRRDAVLAPADALSARSHRVGLFMMVGMLLFYAAFLLVLLARARRESRRFTEPLQCIGATVERIGRGEHRQPDLHFSIRELDEAGRRVVRMGHQMADQVAALEAVQADLQRAKTEAEAGSRAKSRFVAAVSHELRTPLNGVVGMAELLERSELDAGQRRYVEVIRSSARGLVDVIGDVLDFSKVEAGHLVLQPEPLALAPWLEDLVLLHRVAIEAKGLALKMALTPGFEVDVDPTRLRQILVNLLGNAVKFTMEGEIELSVRPEPGSGEGDPIWRFEVRDTGIGIAEAHQPHLFEPFRQAEEGTTRRFGGTGLGLTITRRFVEALGGTIELKSVLGEGSRFIVRLPLPTRRVASEAAPEVCVAPPKEARSLSVLVAEDNPINQEIISALLELQSCEVTLAEDGVEALEQLEQRSFDLCLVDLHMPRMDGLELARQIRRREAWSELPVVAVTASATREDEQACTEAGMDGFLVKPIDVEALKRALDRYR